MYTTYNITTMMKITPFLLVILMTGCVSTPVKQSNLHIKPIVNQSAHATVLPVISVVAPPVIEPDLFTVVVSDVDIKEILFSLAQDASVEIVIDENIKGRITLNAINATFDDILERISLRSNIRYTKKSNIVTVTADLAFTKHYDVSYVNMERSSQSEISISTEVASTGGSSSNEKGNKSNTQITNSNASSFWVDLESGLNSLLENNGKGSVHTSPGSSMISVTATKKQQALVKEFLDRFVTGAQRQVFIEATIVEVQLNDDYQAGVDWSRIFTSGVTDGFQFSQNLLGNNIVSSPVTTFGYSKTGKYQLDLVVKMLSQFGNTRVLSTPKILALNNQTALLKVVDNKVYFTINVETDISNTGAITRTFESRLHTLPVGLVMSVTPQVSSDNMITLNVRPTISRILRMVEDPNPDLGTVKNLIPEVSVREIETLMRVKSGNVAVIGGLMQDRLASSTDGVPGLAKSPMGDLFSYKKHESSKSELIIFLKPVIINSPSLDGEFEKYKRFLK